MAAALKEKFDVEPVLLKGDNGVFDVVVDGTLIFSKDDEGRFPEEREIVDGLGDS